MNWNEPVSGAFLSDALERELEPMAMADAGRIELDFAPYEIKTLKLK
ncbi:hypothetical protein HMSSN139_53310 [Paenibacillus sp. HMSSN-139]|nr:hypothetical protein HMSSN139_53310 [Paenibacillus sp. HMSSN-139]